MRGWAERWAYREGETGGGPAMRYIHRTCGADVGTATVCPGCGEVLRYGALKGEPSPALRAEQAAKAGCSGFLQRALQRVLVLPCGVHHLVHLCLRDLVADTAPQDREIRVSGKRVDARLELGV